MKSYLLVRVSPESLLKAALFTRRQERGATFHPFFKYKYKYINCKLCTSHLPKLLPFRRRVSALFCGDVKAPAPSYFSLFAGVDIPPAFSCGIMIKPDSAPLSACCIISMGQYFSVLSMQSGASGRCVCVCLPVFLLGGTRRRRLRRAGGSCSPRGSNKYAVPPCGRAAGLRDVWIFVHPLVCLFVCRRALRVPVCVSQQAAAGRLKECEMLETKQEVAPPSSRPATTTYRGCGLRSSAQMKGGRQTRPTCSVKEWILFSKSQIVEQKT